MTETGNVTDKNQHVLRKKNFFNVMEKTSPIVY